MSTDSKPPVSEPHAFRTRKGRYSHWNWAPILALACAAAASFYPVPTTFDVSAVTDRVGYAVSERTAPVKWTMQNAILNTGWDDSAEEITNGTFQPGGDVDIHFERIGHGDLIIDCHARDTSGSVGIVALDDHERVLPNRALFRLHVPLPNENAIYPLAGHITIGDVVKPLSPDPSPGILHGGTVTPIGHTIFSNSRYEVGSTSLEPGDEFTVDPGGDSKALGFISVDDRPSISVTYRQIGRAGQVSRYGGTGFDIEIPLISRIEHDSVLQGFWAVFIFITGLRILGPKKRGSAE